MGVAEADNGEHMALKSGEWWEASSGIEKKHDLLPFLPEAEICLSRQVYASIQAFEIRFERVYQNSNTQHKHMNSYDRRNFTSQTRLRFPQHSRRLHKTHQTNRYLP
jgi:hypothetical protein